MKKLFHLVSMLLFIGLTATKLSGERSRDGNQQLKERFIGAWRDLLFPF